MNISNNTSVRYESNKSIVFSAIIATAVFVFQIFGVPRLVSVCFYISIILVASNYFLKITATKRMSVYVLIIAVLMLLSFAVSGFVLDFEVYKRAIIVMCCIICIEDAKSSKLRLTEFRTVEFSFIIAAILANFMFYLAGLRNQFFYDTKSVSMNFANPNALALWLTVFLIALLECFFVEKTKFFKFLALASAVSLLPIIYATESRNSFISCALVIIAFTFVALTSKKRKIKKLPNWVSLLFTALPVLVFFVYMYVILPNIDFFTEVFSFLLGKGKSLTSRAYIWQTVIDQLAPCFLLGRYNAFYNEQMHNSLITLYCMFGAPITFLISSVFYNTVKRKNIYSQIALLGIWSTGCFEASVFVGVAGIYLMLQILPTIGASIEQNSVEQR